MGDFNIHVGDTSDNHALAFSKFLSDVYLIQHVIVQAHINKHTLELAIAPTNFVCTPKIRTLGLSPSAHFPVMTSIDLSSVEHASCQTHRSFRRLGAVDSGQFTSALAESNHIQNPSTDLADLVESYNSTLSHLLDWHASLIIKTVTLTSHLSNGTPYTPALQTLKSLCRIRQSKPGRERHSLADWAIFKSSQSKYFAKVKHVEQ